MDSQAPAQRMLDAVVGYFTDQGWDLPPRQYLSAGSPMAAAADDAHLLVGLDRILPGPSDVSARGGALLSRGLGAVAVARAVYMVRLMWCVTGLSDDADIPSAATLSADGARLMRDPGRLLTALIAWRENEPLLESSNGLVTIGQVDTLGPAGYLAGCAATVTISPVQ